MMTYWFELLLRAMCGSVALWHSESELMSMVPDAIEGRPNARDLGGTWGHTDI